MQPKQSYYKVVTKEIVLMTRTRWNWLEQFPTSSLATRFQSPAQHFYLTDTTLGGKKADFSLFSIIWFWLFLKEDFSSYNKKAKKTFLLHRHIK